MADHYWKQHDTAPACVFSFTDLNGNIPPGDLTGATVKFFMKAAGAGSLKVNGTATIVDAPSWTFGYQPVSADTDTAGDYEAEFEVTYSSGGKQTFPDPGYLDILITADLDGA